MRILITGGGGYVGSVAAHLLLGKGHAVRVLDCLLHDGAPLAGLYPYDQFEFVRGDVRSAATVKSALEGVDAVVHLAAIVGDPACSRKPDLAREINVEASLRLLDLSRQARVKRLVFSSTCSNYGKMADPSDYATEESDLRPVSLYAETKVAFEKALLSTASGGGPAATVLRFSTVFGISPRMRFDLTVNEFTMEMLVNRRLTVYGEQFWRPYLHVRDAARAVALVLESPADKVRGEVFNVGDKGQNYQKGKLAEMVRGFMDPGLPIDYVRKQEDPRDYRVAFDKIQGTLGFAITRTVPDGIREVSNALSQGVFPDLAHSKYRN